MKHRIFLSAALLISSLSVFATVEIAKVGDLYYNLYSESQTAELISRQDVGVYTGNYIEIPSSVSYGGKSYTVTRIGERAFMNASVFAVDIPNTVTSIGYRAFAASNIVAVNIPNSVTTLGKDVFYQAANLRLARLSEGLTAIEPYCFAKCAALDSVVIPSSVKYIGSMAFAGCSGMYQVLIGSGVDSIAEDAFYECDELDWFYIYAQNPPTLGGTIFSERFKPANIFVPCGTRDAYKAAWTAYADSITYDTPWYNLLPSPHGTVTIPDTICDPLIATPDPGYKFVKWNDGSKENPYYFQWENKETDIKAIFAAEGETVPETKVETTTNTATFTFPYVMEAKKYFLYVYVVDNGKQLLVRTVLFDEFGNVVSTSGSGSAPRKALRLNDNFVYTLTNVDANASYSYAMEAHDDANQLINTDKGSFGAELPTSIEITNDQLPMANKVLRNGQLIILRDGKQYNALGAEMR